MSTIMDKAKETVQPSKNELEPEHYQPNLVKDKILLKRDDESIKAFQSSTINWNIVIKKYAFQVLF